MRRIHKYHIIFIISIDEKSSFIYWQLNGNININYYNSNKKYVRELEILIKKTVDTSLLKTESLRKPLDIEKLSPMLKVVCNNSRARFYLRHEELKRQLEQNNINEVQRLAEILKIEGIRILNEVSNNALENDKVNEIIEYILKEHYFKEIKEINI